MARDVMLCYAALHPKCPSLQLERLGMILQDPVCSENCHGICCKNIPSYVVAIVRMRKKGELDGWKGNEVRGKIGVGEAGDRAV
jgi:hypothetical protein